MTVTAQQKLNNTYNEFIREFCESHGNNHAARDEAHERAAWCTNLGQSVAEMFIKAKLDESSVDYVLVSIPEIDAEEISLVACAVAVALEEGK